jgi:hypothetical protein
MDRDYTVFVHLLDPDGSLVAQDDGPPVKGHYPTSLWAPGEVIIDPRSISLKELPSGAYQLRAGMYLLETGDRLPVVDEAREQLPESAIPLARVHLP